MDLNNEFDGSDAELIECIKAMFLLLDRNIVKEGTAGTIAINLIESAGARLSPTAAHIAELEAQVRNLTSAAARLEGENEKLRKDLRAATPPAPDGMTIRMSDVPDPNKESAGPVWQDFDVQIQGEIAHYCMIRVVRRMAGKEQDEPAVELIKRRLLAGNPPPEDDPGWIPF